MSYEMNRFKSGVLVTMSGEVTLTQIGQANDRIYGLTDFAKHNFQIFDLLAADMTPIAPTDISQTALDDKMQSILKKEYKVALVATNNHSVEICTEYQKVSDLYNSNWETKIFDTLENAKIWVGLTE